MISLLLRPEECKEDAVTEERVSEREALRHRGGLTAAPGRLLRRGPPSAAMGLLYQLRCSGKAQGFFLQHTMSGILLAHATNSAFPERTLC